MVAILIISCNQTPLKKVNEGHLKTFFISKIKEIDSTMTLETFTFIKLDTTTLKNQYIQLFNGMNDKSEEYVHEINKLGEKLKLSKELLNLSSGLSYSAWKTSKDNAVDDAMDDSKTARELYSKDSLLIIDMRRVDSLIITADNKKPVSYIANCLYIIRKKDQSISKDTVGIRLDLDYNILDKVEYAKHVNRLYNPISDYVFE